MRRNLRTALDLAVVGAYVSRPNSDPVSIPSQLGTWTTVAMTTEVFDTASMWDAGTPKRLTVTQAGLYIVTVTGGFVANATGDRAIGIIKNGGASALFQNQARAPLNSFWTGSATAVDQAVVGDYYELALIQNSGAGLNSADCDFAALGFGQT